MKTIITTIAITLALFFCSVNAQVLVKDISPGKDSSYLRGLTNVNGILYFIGEGPGLWRSDGTESGTVMIGTTYSQTLTNVNGILYFFAPVNPGQFGGPTALWKYDSTVKGSSIKMVKNFQGWISSTFSKIINVNGTLFFKAFAAYNRADLQEGYRLLKSDGTEKGTVIINAYHELNPYYDHPPTENLFKIKETLFFAGWDSTHGNELWKTDGTEAGTVMVKDINAVYTSTGDTQGSGPANFIDVNDTLFFTADDGVHGSELWKTDGTATGTVMVKDIEVGRVGSSMYGFTDVNGILYFAASSNRDVLPHYGTELWKSDGTAKGTVMVKDIFPGRDSSSPYQLTNVNGTLFFAANDGIHGVELWKSNGTAAGTVMVKDINFPPPSRSHLAATESSIAPRGEVAEGSSLTLTNANGVLYFSANDGIHGAELWKSDGTAAGTVMVKDIKPFSNFGSEPRNLIYINGTLFFTADDGPHGNELWKYDIPVK